MSQAQVTPNGLGITLFGTLQFASDTKPISGNADGAGGGINNLGGAVDLNNTAVPQYEASIICGGGIRNETDGVVTLRNSIVAGNSGCGLIEMVDMHRLINPPCSVQEKQGAPNRGLLV